MTLEKSVVCVLCLHVNTADRTLEDADLGALVGGLDYAGLFLDADDFTDDAADGSNLIANRQVVAHFVLFLLLLFLGANHKEIHCNQHQNDRQETEKIHNIILQNDIIDNSIPYFGKRYKT